MLAAVLLTTLLLSALTAHSNAGHADLALVPAQALAQDDAKWLYKRRRGGGGDSSSDSDSDSSSSSDYDDYDSDSGSGSSSSGSSAPMCYYDKNVTIEMMNTGSFGDFYRAGTGRSVPSIPLSNL